MSFMMRLLISIALMTLLLSCTSISPVQETQQPVMSSIWKPTLITLEIPDQLPSLSGKSVIQKLDEEQEAIRNEIFYGELEELVLLVHAEAGNQDITGKRLVADVVFNRIRSDKFPDTIHDVINQKNQFSTSKSLLKHAYNLTQSDFDAVMMAVDEPLNTKILYFDSLGGVNGTNHFKHGGHWFGE